MADEAEADRRRGARIARRRLTVPECGRQAV